MQELVDILSKTKLFYNIKEIDIEMFLMFMNQNRKKYPKNTILFQEGDNVEELMFVVSGKLEIVKYNYSGQKSILLNLKKGDFFAEAVAFSKGKVSPVTVEATTDCEIISISASKLINNNIGKEFSIQLLSNLLELSFDKSFALNKKIDILSQRTIRDKFLTFLDLECKYRKTNKVKLPFTKQALASYLEVDRTALFRVMKQLQDEGIIEIKDKEITYFH